MARRRPRHRAPADRRFAERAVVAADALSASAGSLLVRGRRSFFVGFSTAWNALVTRADVKAGRARADHRRGGGVGLAAVIVAAHLGAEVVAAASSEAKREAARAAGARHVIDSAAPDFDKQVMEATGGHGADVIYDPVGMAPLTLVRSAAFAARILIIGFTGGAIPDWPANRVLLKCISLIGVRAGEWSRQFTHVRGEENAALLSRARGRRAEAACVAAVRAGRCGAGAAGARRPQAIGRMVVVPSQPPCAMRSVSAWRRTVSSDARGRTRRKASLTLPDFPRHV